MPKGSDDSLNKKPPVTSVGSIFLVEMRGIPSPQSSSDRDRNNNLMLADTYIIFDIRIVWSYKNVQHLRVLYEHREMAISIIR